MNHIYHFIYRYIPLVILLLGSAACHDEIIPSFDYTLSGQEVELSVTVNIPDMDVKSRGIMSDEQKNRVRSLWVRTYSAATGEATSQWVTLSPETTDTEVPRELKINTKSGSTYIVAVANVENKGVTKNNPGNEQPLSTLLSAADTWQQFLDIAAVSPWKMDDVNTAPSPVTMAGCYTTAPVGNPDTHPKLHEWGENINFEPIFIPASDTKEVRLDGGAIHLRRLISHITFNLIPGKNVTITPESYTIVNVPKRTWLYERSGQYANFGDMCTNEDGAADYYSTPAQYTNEYFSPGNDGRYSFNFWQGENMHSALPDAGCDSYDKREREYKGPDGRTNTGLYTSLTGDTWTANNMASYVIVRCHVEYKDMVNVDDDGNAVETGGKEMYRSGNAEYVVHLGYLDNVASDFNSYRNVEYTYNLTVNGVNDIRLEAYGSEKYPGAEGIVSDVEYSTIYLDAHYSTFNIQLSKDELTETSADGKGFGYIITAWENNKEYTYQEGDIIPDSEKKFVDWVELRPTTDEKTLAQYKPRSGAYSDGNTFTLEDAANAKNWDKNDKRFSDSGWYTVFVNEYTYETSANENTYNWTKYVNQNPRRFYIRVTKRVSDDGESLYVRSKYAMSQSSIMTYYNISKLTPASGNIPEGTAIGIERVNETEGLNLRSAFTSNQTNNVNGRWNVWQWIQSKSGRRWDNFVTLSAPQEIPAVTGTAAQNGPEIPQQMLSNHNPVKLPKLANFSTNAPTASTGGGNAPSAYDPQPNSSNANYYIEAINACMNRNRDNNGNGVIDPEELRWYVPATGKYLRLILGSNSLPQPIMDYNATKSIPDMANDYNSRYLFFTSDRKVVWAMEGMSLSSWNQWAELQPAWQIRCIRNLGSDMTSVTSDEKVTQAYEHDNVNRIVRMTYYNPNNIREIPYSGNGDSAGQMPIHMANSGFNMPYKAFEYDNDQVELYDPKASGLKLIYDKINTNPCSKKDTETKKGWRIPNQKELAILRNSGAFTIPNANNYIPSCTVSFFQKDGQGGIFEYAKNGIILARADAITQSYATYNLVYYIKCVRDYTDED